MKKISIVGLTNTMKNGMDATVIEDRGHNDIDIQFADGTVVYHTRRDRFKTRNIANPSLGRMFYKTITHSIVGQEKIMNNGMRAIVIADRGQNDIDVRFEDGTIVCHRSRVSYNKGSMTPYSHGKGITGQSRIMRNGMTAVVLADRGGKDIDVQFSDGTIVSGKTRDDFRRGNIRNPSIQGRSRPQSIVFFFVKKHFPDAILDYRPDWLKNPKTNANLELDIWIPSKGVGIEYDGFIPSHSKETTLGKIKRDLILSSALVNHVFVIHEKGTYEYNSYKYKNYWLSHTSFDKSFELYRDLEKIIQMLLADLEVSSEVIIDNTVIEQICLSYIGESNTMNNGIKAKIVAFKSYDDIDVEFEDGTIVKNRDVYSFRNGKIALPSWHNTVGEKNIMSNGMTAFVIDDRGANDIDIQFEDGVVVTTTRHRFRSGKTQYPRKSMVGMTQMMHSGIKAKVIADRGVNDLDIEFEDGTILKNKAKKEFLNGHIAHPKHYLVNEQFIGQRRKMHNGMFATVIAYRDFKDIDVEFEDGTIVEHTRRDLFNNGYIKNPNLLHPKLESTRSRRLGQTKEMHNGMNATIIEYRNSKDIDVKFEDGTIVMHTVTSMFDNACIANPNLIESKQEKYVGLSKKLNNGMKVTIITYRKYTDIDVQFEDGTIVRTSMSSFNKGYIRKPK